MWLLLAWYLQRPDVIMYCTFSDWCVFLGIIESQKVGLCNGIFQKLFGLNCSSTLSQFWWPWSVSKVTQEWKENKFVFWVIKHLMLRFALAILPFFHYALSSFFLSFFGLNFVLALIISIPVTLTWSRPLTYMLLIL